MSAYHQMGHDSSNLLADVPGFSGAIVSPVNETEAEVCAIIGEHGSDGFEFIFDPQLYAPHNANKGKLSTWGYFPKDLDTADLGSQAWWDTRLQDIADTATRIGVKAICSPAVLPQTFPDGYYEWTRYQADALVPIASPHGVRVLQSVVARMADLSAPHRALEIASIVSNTKTAGVYLILLSDTKPRDELRDEEQLKGAMKLIHALETAGLPVLVSCASSDVVLWKAAGATSCATGKFLNLRRFTTGRFSNEESGGRQVPYWFEEQLLAFIRQSDILRVQQHGIATTTSNPFGQRILRQLVTDPGAAWVALGWRQYMYWFANMEARLSSGTADPRALIRDAEAAWQMLASNDVFMEEPTNDGRWLRPWLRALVEFNR